VRGNLYAWGWNSQGEIGDGTTTSALTPTQVKILQNVQFTAPTRERPTRRYIDAGGSLPAARGGVEGHSLALDSKGAVWAWGSNNFGQLGSSDRTDTATPAQVTRLAEVKVVDIAAGGGHSLALDTDGAVWAWGWNNVHQLGDGSTQNNATPHKVSSLKKVHVAAVVAGGGHSLALDTDGAVWAWGWDNMCQLGNNQQLQYNVAAANSTAAKVSGLADVRVVDIAAGGGHGLALDDKGGVWAWGWNNVYQLGNGNIDNSRWQPTKVDGGLTNVKVMAINAGQGHSLVIGD
jgi:alpha-tubulin suppressor-like RCC1 family protein